MNDTPEQPSATIRFYQNLIAHLPNLVYWGDRQGRRLGCNDNVLKFFGLSQEEFKGCSFEQFEKMMPLSQEDIREWQETDRKIIATDVPKLNIEEKVRLNNGEYVYFLTSRISMVDESGHITGVLGISTDITERKKMEKELRKAKEKAEAANQAMEEIQNYYTSIIHAMPNLVYWGDAQGGSSPQAISKIWKYYSRNYDKNPTNRKRNHSYGPPSIEPRGKN